ncbi:hypothetical protein SANTM175S_06431 [Streptomyces antimycoticus]
MSTRTGRWVALGGGGYAVVDVVPRSWTHLVAIAAGRPVEATTPVPEEWRQEVYRRTRMDAPRRMTDGRGGRRTYPPVAYVRGIAMVQAPGARPTLSEPGAHSHSPLPVRVALGSAAESGGPLPGLVIGDHGYAVRGQLGFEAIGLGDTDDPALFVGEAEGRVSVAVPLDDAVRSGYTTGRLLAMYSIERVCHSRRPIATPLPHLHHPPLTWGGARMRQGVTGGEAGARHVRKVQVLCHGCWRTASERGSVSDRGGSRLGDASVQDDRVPPGAQRSSAGDPGGRSFRVPEQAVHEYLRESYVGVESA